MYAIPCKNCGHQESPHCFERSRIDADLDHPERPVCDEYEMSEEDQKLHDEYVAEEQAEKDALAGRRYYLVSLYGGVIEL